MRRPRLSDICARLVPSGGVPKLLSNSFGRRYVHVALPHYDVISLSPRQWKKKHIIVFYLVGSYVCSWTTSDCLLKIIDETSFASNISRNVSHRVFVIKRLSYDRFGCRCIRHCVRVMFQKMNIWKTDRHAFFDSSVWFCSCNSSIGVTSFKLKRQCFIGQHILFQTLTSAAVTHVKMEALVMTASTSTAASAFRGTRVLTVKQVGVAFLFYLLKHSFNVSSCN